MRMPQTVRQLHTTDATRAQARRVANRAKGWTSFLTTRFSSVGEPRTPRQTQNWLRSLHGRLVSHPKAGNVEVLGDGRVRLTGHILENELDPLLTGVESVSGVTHVDNALMVHESAGHVAKLQGAGRRPGWLRTQRWSRSPVVCSRGDGAGRDSGGNGATRFAAWRSGGASIFGTSCAADALGTCADVT